MRRREWSTWARVSSAMLMALGLVVAAGHAQQLADSTQGYSPQGQGSYDATQMAPSADPPTRVARLSVAQGNVSVEPASVNEFSPAEVNYPMTTGDRLWTDYDALAELEAGQLAVRMGQTTDLTVTAMTDTLAQFGLGQGSVHLRTYDLDPDVTTELDTPNVAVTVLARGDVRVDVEPNTEGTVVTVFAGVVEVDGNALQETVGAGQAVRFVGLNPVSAQWLVLPRSDALDGFSSQRDQLYQSDEAAEQNYLNVDTVGGADLQQYGSWLPDADYGTVWFPSAVPEGWQPYCYGRWTWVAPWGWTWIESEPWGFAPFHYGRWAMFGGRWGWIPGPPIVHPVYAPALVVFVHAGNGVSAWFPLGPNEPYAPWYHSSALYLNRVNVSNLYNRNVNQVRTVYNTSNREFYANALGPQRQFVNRAVATVAVSQQNFAGGKPVRGTMMHLPAQQIAAAPVLPHPMISPDKTMVASGHAKALPPKVARPTLTSHEDQAVGRESQLPHLPQQATGTQPSEQAAPVERRGNGAASGTQASGEPNQIEYRDVPPAGGEANAHPGGAAGVTPPQEPQEPSANPPQDTGQSVQLVNPQSNANRTNAATETQPPSQPNPPANRNGVATGTQAAQQTGQQTASGMTIKGGVRPPNPTRGTMQLPRPGAAEPQVQMPYNEPQQLYNRAVPPPPRPSFDEQRQAIQSTDPGRPLSPQQLDNLRENRPVGQPEEREAAPHPASAPAPPRSSPPPQPRPDNRH